MEIKPPPIKRGIWDVFTGQCDHSFTWEILDDKNARCLKCEQVIPNEIRIPKKKWWQI